MLPVSVTRAASRGLPLVAAVLLLVSCGGGDGEEGNRPEISPTRTPTASVPSLGLPSITRSPGPTGSAEPPSVTRSPEPTESAQPPIITRSPEPTDSPDAPTTAASSAPEPETTPETAASTAPETEVPGEDSAQGSAGDDNVPAWVWWLLAALVLASAVAIPLIVRARRRNAWQRDLGGAEAELAWFARVLLPELRQAGSREQVAGGWAVGEPRVAAAEDRLTALEPTAPDDAGRTRALSLRDASRQARARMAQLTGPVPNDTWALDLDAIIADLEAVLQSKMEA
jgi:hypothetical protein